LEDLEDFSAKQTKKRQTGVPLRGRNLTNLTNLTELNISLGFIGIYGNLWEFIGSYGDL
jgi:hypothetical protein